MGPAQPNGRTSSAWSPRTFGLIAFLAIAAFYLLTEHTAHLFGALPYLLLLACPLLHLFMHRGHGTNGGADHTKTGSDHGQPPPGETR